jgi:hypothetical protein
LSSSTNAPYPGVAWDVNMTVGYVDYYIYKSDGIYVWPVRGGQCGNSVISGTVTNADSDPTSALLVNAQVTIDGQAYTTDSSGKYKSDNLPKGSHDVTAAKSTFVSSPTVTVTLADTPVTQDFSLTPEPITVNTLTSKYKGFLYYLVGTDFTVNFTADVDWDGHDPGKVKFVTSNTTYDATATGATASQSLNIGLEFSPCTILKAVAVSADGTKSAEKLADFTLMSPILGGLTFNAIDFGTGFYYKGSTGFDLTLIDEGIRDGLIPNDIPLFGQTGFNLRYVPTISAKVESNGKVTSWFRL